jgi:uncharacterized membrane protein
MDPIEIVHIAAGGAGLATGYVALYAAKGGRLHRTVGMQFVYVMLLMCATGLVVTLSRSIALSTNVSAALLTAYLVITSLTTVRPLGSGGRRLHVGGMVVASGIALANAVFLVRTFQGNAPDGMPAFPFVMFGTIALLAVAGDIRVLRQGALHGVSRLARHLWRMSFALFIAAMSFFIGQSDEFPAALRIMPVLALPVLAVLVTMIYWMWRVRVRRSLRGLTSRMPAPEIAREGALTAGRRPARIASHVQQPIEERPITLQRDPEIFGGHLFTAVPLAFETGLGVRKGLGKTLNSLGDELVGLFNRLTRCIDEASLDIRPTWPQIVGDFVGQQVHVLEFVRPRVGRPHRHFAIGHLAIGPAGSGSDVRGGRAALIKAIVSHGLTSRSVSTYRRRALASSAEASPRVTCFSTTRSRAPSSGPGSSRSSNSSRYNTMAWRRSSVDACPRSRRRAMSRATR